MKRFLIAASIVALVAPTAAPSFAQDGGGRGRGDRGGQNVDRGDRGQRGGGERNFGGGGDRGGRSFDRGDRGQRFGGDPNAVTPPVQQVRPQRQFQDRGDRGQFQGRQDRGQAQAQGQFQGGQRQFQGGQRQFQGGQRQFQGQNQFQGRRDFDRNDRRFDNGRQFQGQRFGGAQRFDNRRDFQSRRFQGQAPRGGQRFSYNGRDFYRFRSTPYVWPRGWNGGFNSVSWALNQLLPSMFLSQNYYIDPNAYGLPFADPGYQWVQVGNDALLIDVYTGLIVDIVPGVFYW